MAGGKRVSTGRGESGQGERRSEAREFADDLAPELPNDLIHDELRHDHPQRPGPSEVEEHDPSSGGESPRPFNNLIRIDYNGREIAGHTIHHACP